MGVNSRNVIVERVKQYQLCFSAGLQASFNKFGNFKIEWPGKDGKSF